MLNRLFLHLLVSVAVGVVALSSIWVPQASAQMYAADLATAEWKLAATPFACSLTHTIPGFGKAVLARKAGGAESLVLDANGKAAFPPGLTGVETLPPVWRNDLAPVGLGVVVANAGNQPLVLDASHLAPVSMQLNAGVKVMFTSQPVTGATSSMGLRVMRVVLEAKNFAPAYKTYQQCVADMIPYTLSQVARTTLNYDENPVGLTQAHKASLSRVVRYLKADPKVIAVYVDGHSDSSAAAEANLDTSKQQAEAVSAYVGELGVAADKVTTRWHGDKFPIADNKTPAGRAQNRRVTVRLEDEAMRAQSEQKTAQKAAAQAAEQVAAEKRAADQKALEEKLAAQKAEAQKAAETQASLPKGARNSPAAQAISAAGEKSESLSGRKLTPEQINRMVEGLDAAPGRSK